MVAVTDFDSVCLKFNWKIITLKLKPLFHFEPPQPIRQTQFLRKYIYTFKRYLAVEPSSVLELGCYCVCREKNAL